MAPLETGKKQQVQRRKSFNPSNLEFLKNLMLGNYNNYGMTHFGMAICRKNLKTQSIGTIVKLCGNDYRNSRKMPNLLFVLTSFQPETKI